MDGATRFRFSDLPAELRQSVLKRVDTWEQKILLRCNKLVRHLVLHNGPFPSKINRIELRFDQNRCHLIAITDNYNDFFIFWDEEHGTFKSCGTDYEWKIETSQPFQLYHRILKSCRSLIISVVTYGDREWLMGSFFSQGILPEIRHTVNYSIRGKFAKIQPILENFNPRVSQIFDLLIEPDATDSIHIKESLKKFFTKRELKDCKIVNFRRPMIEYFDVLSHSNAQIFLDVNYTKKEDFLSTVHLLIERGLPIGHPNGMAVIKAKFKIYMDFFQDDEFRSCAYARTCYEFLDHFHSFDRLQKMKGDTIEAKALYTSFIEAKFGQEDLTFLGDGCTDYDNPYIFAVKYKKKSFYRKEFPNSGRVCVIGLLVEEDRYEEYSEEYLDYCDYEIESDCNFRVSFLMKYV